MAWITYAFGDITANTGVLDASGHTWWASIPERAGPAGSATSLPRGGVAGEWFQAGFQRRKTITLAGKVQGSSWAEMLVAQERLENASNFVGAQGALTVVRGGITTSWTVFREAGPRFRRLAPTLAEWEIDFVALDPRRYGAEVSASFNLSAITGGITAPLTAPITAGGGVASAVTALNIGTAPTPVILDIAGPVTNPTVTHDQTGSVLRWGGMVVAGDVLRWDTDVRTVSLGGSSRRSSVIGRPGWFALAPGANSIRFSAASTDPAASLTARWRPAWW